MGFKNPPIGGTTLVRKAIKSPNFLTGSAGWSINKDGTVEFNSGTFRGIVSVSNGTGQGWELTNNQLIALGSFKYVGGADGFLYAVPTTTTSGVSDLFIAGPTDLNLIPVVTLNGESNDGTQLPQIGFTTFNNTTMVTSGLPLSLWNMLAVPPTPLNGPTIYAISGQAKYKSTDGNAYSTGRLYQSTTSTQAFTLASAVAITGLSVPLGIGTYHVRLVVYYQPSGTIASVHTHSLAFTGTATGNCNGNCWQAQAASALQAVQGFVTGALGALTSSPTHVAHPGWLDFECDITVTVAGTLTTTVTLATAGDGITTQPGSFWEVTPTS
jgi:hypothetical protein